VLSNAIAQKEISLQLYPNPASDYLTVSFDSTPFEVIIKDMNGRVVWKASLSGKTNKVSLQNLKKGLYVVVVTNDKFFKTQKLLIN
jgi:hypothetical protein